jgi:hypothetical protein
MYSYLIISYEKILSQMSKFNDSLGATIRIIYRGIETEHDNGLASVTCMLQSMPH